MSDEKLADSAHPWTGGPAAWRAPPRQESPLARFLGGSPVAVALRLFFLSLVVGALLMWLDIRPADVIEDVLNFFHRIWAMGFSAVRLLGNYVLAGAVIVLPVWLILRLVNFRGR